MKCRRQYDKTKSFTECRNCVKKNRIVSQKFERNENKSHNFQATLLSLFESHM